MYNPALEPSINHELHQMWIKQVMAEKRTAKEQSAKQRQTYGKITHALRYVGMRAGRRLAAWGERLEQVSQQEHGQLA